MSTVLLNGWRSWGGSVDEEGHRTYQVEHIVECGVADGPANVLQTPGLPEAGDEWQFGDDVDIWAFCREDKKLTKMMSRDGEPNTHWLVESTFSTKPPPREKSRCQDERVEDPLLEPAKVGGSSTNKVEEALTDRFGFPVRTSSHELIRGPQNEWDVGLDTIKIEQNVATAFQGYVLPSLFKNCVNAYPLWGFSPRCIKLVASPWERVFYGRCSVYYKRSLEFLIDPRTHDREILDEGTKALHGHFDAVSGDYVLDLIGGELPQYYNAQHFIRFKDRNGENTRVVLNGRGCPASVNVISTAIVPFQNSWYVPLGEMGVWSTLPLALIQDLTVLGNGNQTIRVQTSGAHNRSTGDVVRVSDVDGVGAPAANGTWTIDVLNATVFELRGSNFVGNMINAGGRYSVLGDINSIDDTNPTPVIIYEQAGHGLVTGQIVVIDSGTQYDGQHPITVIDATHFSLDGTVGSDSVPHGTVTGATNANPIVITSVAHGLRTGDMVTIEGVGGNTNANGTYTITRVGDDTFSLNSSTGNGAYTAGGTWRAVGATVTSEQTNIGHIKIEKYNEADFLLLGIPTQF